MLIPCDDLASHFVPRVREVARETKICNLELAVRGDQQIVWLQILWDQSVIKEIRKRPRNVLYAE